jgi:hypothetical protein
VLSVLFFAAALVFLISTATQVLTRGWGPFDVERFHIYFVVLPQYLLLTAGVLLIAGCVSAFPMHL